MYFVIDISHFVSSTERSVSHSGALLVLDSHTSILPFFFFSVQGLGDIFTLSLSLRNIFLSLLRSLLPVGF